jgi:hypothetical protein
MIVDGVRWGRRPRQSVSGCSARAHCCLKCTDIVDDDDSTARAQDAATAERGQSSSGRLSRRANPIGELPLGDRQPDPIRMGTVSHHQPGKFEQTVPGAHRCLLRVPCRQARVGSPQLRCKVSEHRNREIRMFAQAVDEVVAGHPRNDTGLGSAGSRRPRALVESRQLTERVAGKFEPQHQLATRRHRHVHLHRAGYAGIDVDRRIALVEERLPSVI